MLNRLVPHLFAILMSPDDAGGGGAGDVLEIELQGGIKVKLPKAEAEKYQAARAKDKQERDAAFQKIGAAEEAQRAADAAKQKAEKDRELAETIKKGEVEEVRKVATRETNEKLSKLAAGMIKDRLSAAATRIFPGLASVDYDDIVALNSSRVRFNTETLALDVVDEAGQPAQHDGKPLSVDALLESFAKGRDRFKTVKQPAGDGLLSRGEPPRTTGTMSRAEYDRALESGKLSPQTRQAIAQGKITLID